MPRSSQLNTNHIQLLHEVFRVRTCYYFPGLHCLYCGLRLLTPGTSYERLRIAGYGESEILC
jgi:hypothetical protein